MTLPDTYINSETDTMTSQNNLYSECVRIVYQRRSQNLLSHILVSALPFYLGWTNEAGILNALLVFLLWVYVVVAYYFTLSFNKSSPENNDSKPWATSLYYQLIGLAILYNIIFLNLEYHGVENAMIYLLLTTALFSAGAINSYQHLKGLGPLFVVTAMLPQCIYYLASSGTGTTLMAFLIFVFVLFITSLGFSIHKDAVRSLALNHELSLAKEQAEQLARTDVLTGLNNRRSFFEIGNSVFQNACRYKRPLSVVMLDLDAFKNINDTYGHSIGDEIIKAVANKLHQGKRETDITGRIGGEEFAILLQETDLKTAGELIERLRTEVEQIVVNSNGTQVGITASFGVTELDEQCDTLEKVIVKADRALYQAKEEGRNRVVLI